MLNKEVLICAGTGCLSSGAQKIFDEFKMILDNHKDLADIKVKKFVKKTGCVGPCSLGPIAIIKPSNTFYGNLKVEDVGKIVNQDLLNDQIVEELLIMVDDNRVVNYEESRFIRNQTRIALKNTGDIDPNSINDYIDNDGYEALHKVVTEMSKEEVIEVIKGSELRGRGGAGFPTGLKWEFTHKATGEEKFVVCNADEGDPGAFMDRSILEGDPHAVLEAMAICGYSTGADKGLIYIRAEYPLAIKRLKIAIKQAREYGLLGENIFGTDFNFDIQLRYGAGAFVCGEETALIHSMEGERGEPTFKPPFPAESGYLGKPTNVNNVETYANVPVIINKGAEWFSKIGTEKSSGTKVFALAGKVNNVGLIEVPMGTTLREVIFEIGGGIKDGKKFKAVQTGGPSGGCLTEKHLDTPIEYDTLIAAGSMMGSGGMIVMDEDDCMVSVAKFYLEFTVEESCGKCSPCRIGNKRLFELLERITQGNGTMDDLQRLRNMSDVIKDTSLCGLGQTSPNPILSTLDNFWDEYVAHVEEKRCPAGVCTDLMKYEIIPENCVGCTACARACPVGCISGERKQVHEIDQDTCIKCGACMKACKFDAVTIK